MQKCGKNIIYDTTPYVLLWVKKGSRQRKGFLTVSSLKKRDLPTLFDSHVMQCYVLIQLLVYDGNLLYVNTILRMQCFKSILLTRMIDTARYGLSCLFTRLCSGLCSTKTTLPMSNLSCNILYNISQRWIFLVHRWSNLIWDVCKTKSNFK